MSGKIPASGFKSPAPVLPGLGLHSFHNDSPPFAPASQHAKGEPDHFSLDSPPMSTGNTSPKTTTTSATSEPYALRNTHHDVSAHPPSPGSLPPARPSLPTLDRPASSDHLAHPVPIRQQGFDPCLVGGRSGQDQDRPIPTRLPTSTADDELSVSRSRRLLSGYLFGNPPSPLDSSPSSPARLSSSIILPTAPNVEDEAGANGETIEGYANPPPPSQTRDSTPVSTVSSSPELESGPDETVAAPPAGPPNEPGYQFIEEINRDASLRLENIRLDDQDAGASGRKPASTVNEQVKQQDKESSKGKGAAQEELKRRRSSRVRDKEIGYDALTGYDDGEADADDNAPQAVFGSRQYLLGAEGEAGEYRFPRHRLRTRMKDESKIPLVIVACGSFSPPTYLHLRMFEMAKDEIVESQTFEIMAGYYSPVSSYYKKAGLAPAVHRVRMCELAVEHTSTWLMVDPWEAGQPEYTRTAVVLEHFNEMLNVQGGGLVMSDGKRRKYKIMLLAGGDLIESFGEPGVWSEPDLHIILGRFGCLIVERAGSDVWAFLLSHDILYHHRRNVIVIKQLIYNDISSTKVRLFVKRGMSIKYLLPNSVIQYIYDNKLYR